MKNQKGNSNKGLPSINGNDPLPRIESTLPNKEKGIRTIYLSDDEPNKWHIEMENNWRG